MIGSSPLTRGKPHARGRVRHPGRLIPAHAGKTHRRDLHEREGAAHPRSRGENDLSGDIILAEEGSSPLTRGKPR